MKLENDNNNQLMKKQSNDYTCDLIRLSMLLLIGSLIEKKSR